MSGIEVRLSPTDPNESVEAREWWANTDFQAREYRNETAFYAARLADLATRLAPASVLEFGANAGRNLALIRDALGGEPDVLGLDVNEASVEFGKEKFGLDLRVGDETVLGELVDDSWDLVFTVSVLDHLPDPHRALAELARVCGRWLVLVEPHPADAGGKLESFRSEWAAAGGWKEATPFSYLHDYDCLLTEMDFADRINIPFPTSLARLGPIYRLRLLEKTKNAADPAPFAEFVEETLRLAQLRMLEARQRAAVAEPAVARAAKLEERIAHLQARVQEVEATARECRTLVEQKEAELDDTHSTTSYRLGQMIVHAVRRPWRLFALPFRMAALAVSRRRRS